MARNIVEELKLILMRIQILILWGKKQNNVQTLDYKNSLVGV